MWELLDYILNGIVSASIYVLVALGLALILGILGISQFAHGEIYMIGAYVTYSLVRRAGASYFVALVGSAAAASILGATVEILAFRPLRGKPPYLAMISSLGLSMVFLEIARLVWSPDPQVYGTALSSSIAHIGDLFISKQRLLIPFVAFSLVFALYLFTQRTLIGKAMRAASMDLDATALMGVNTKVLVTIVFAIGSALAAIAGGLLGPISALVPHMGTLVALKAFSVIIFGGYGDIRGIVAASLLIGIAESLTAGYISTLLRDSVAFVILILVLVLRPQGIFGTRTGRMS